MCRLLVGTHGLGGDSFEVSAGQEETAEGIDQQHQHQDVPDCSWILCDRTLCNRACNVGSLSISI
ncbi:TPA: hypothetical protein ACH3X3_000190 [Trebouxia sp. C0006]